MKQKLVPMTAREVSSIVSQLRVYAKDLEHGATGQRIIHNGIDGVICLPVALVNMSQRILVIAARLEGLVPNDEEVEITRR